MMNQVTDEINYFNNLKDFILCHRDNIASLLFILWIVCCGYWLYQITVVDVKLPEGYTHYKDLITPREAIVITFFGIFGLIYITVIAFYIIKFAINLIWGEIKNLFPKSWHSLVTSIALLILLLFSFPYIEKIKLAGLIAYNQVSEIVQKARKHTMYVSIDVPRLPDFDEEVQD